MKRNIRIIFLFGMAGVGKNFIGEKLSKVTNWYFYDADNEFTQEEIGHLKRVTFTDEMRDDYYGRVVLNIKNLLNNHDKIIVASCLVKERHRNQLLELFEDNIEFIYIYADDGTITKRLLKRKHFFPISKYSVLLKKYDKVKDSFPCLKFNNNDNDSSISPILSYLNYDES